VFSTQLGKQLRVVNSIVAILLLSSAHARSAIAAPDSSTQTASVYWGAYIYGAPFNMALIDDVEAQAGKKMSIVHWGQPWVMNGAFQAFQAPQYAAIRARGAIPMVDWSSWDLGKGPEQPAFRLSNVANGQYDAYISQWADAARAWGEPFFLRFDWEMNGWWQFPWAEQINGNQWGDYVHAWRHVHDIFVHHGAINVTWVWCPNISSARTRSLQELYPGDSYVDWTCMDGYNFGTDNGNLWQNFSEVFAGSMFNAQHNTYAELLALAPQKPIIIGETASSEHGGSKAGWITDMLIQIPANFPQIKGVVWFDWNGGDPSTTWPLSSSPGAHDAFASGIAASAYAANGSGSQPRMAALQPLSATTDPPDVPSLESQPGERLQTADSVADMPELSDGDATSAN
jgi:beta-mannanase